MYLPKYTRSRAVRRIREPLLGAGMFLSSALRWFRVIKRVYLLRRSLASQGIDKNLAKGGTNHRGSELSNAGWSAPSPQPLTHPAKNDHKLMKTGPSPNLAGAFAF